MVGENSEQTFKLFKLNIAMSTNLCLNSAILDTIALASSGSVPSNPSFVVCLIYSQGSRFQR